MKPRVGDPRVSEKKSEGRSEFTQSRRILTLRLLARSKGENEKIFRFDKERMTLGSVGSADIRLTGEGISPIHAVLEVNQNPETGKVSGTLFDLASETGVFVNGKKVITHSLVE